MDTFPVVEEPTGSGPWGSEDMASTRVERAAFRAACSRFTTGIAVVTLLDTEGLPHGLTVNSFTSVSLDPPLILFCLDKRSRVLPHFRSSRSFAVNVLGETQRQLAETFSGPVDGRFLSSCWTPGSTGAPLFSGAIAIFECTVTKMVIGGDHIILIGAVNQASTAEGNGLVYFRNSYQSLAVCP